MESIGCLSQLDWYLLTDLYFCLLVLWSVSKRSDVMHFLVEDLSKIAVLPVNLLG